MNSIFRIHKVGLDEAEQYFTDKRSAVKYIKENQNIYKPGLTYLYKIEIVNVITPTPLKIKYIDLENHITGFGNGIKWKQ